MNIKNAYRLTVTAALMLAGSTVFAQGNNTTDLAQTQSGDNNAVNNSWRNSLVTDGVYDRTQHETGSLTWQPVREADIMWKKRVWREIDVRERQNLPFRFPGDENTGGGYFIEILMDAIKKGKIQAFSTTDDRFTSPMDAETIKQILSGKDDTLEVFDPVTNATKLIISHKDFDPETVVKYRMKEDWVFDRNLGRMVVRIIGIAPFIEVRDQNSGDVRGLSPLFWIYYPKVREVLAQYEVFNPDNDVQRMTWDDFFESRFFSSHIVKMSNPFDQFISAIPGMNPMEALYESNRSTEAIFNKEHDMWVY